MTIIHRSPLPDVDGSRRRRSRRTCSSAPGEHPDRARVRRRRHRSLRHVRRARRHDPSRRRPASRRAASAPVMCVGILAPNVPEYAAGVPRCGRPPAALTTTINPTYGAEEVRYQLNDAGARAARHRRAVPRHRAARRSRAPACVSSWCSATRPTATPSRRSPRCSTSRRWRPPRSPATTSRSCRTRVARRGCRRA